MRLPYQELPIYKKAKEIQKLVDSLMCFVEDYPFEINYDFDQELVDESIASMEDKTYAMQYAIQENCWVERQYHEAMERAVLVKHYAEEIVCDVNRLESTGLKESEFVDLFHDVLDEFRVLFVEWIKTFNKWRYYMIDADWGLFDLNADVVVINYLTGERYDEDNPLHRIMNSDDEDEDDEYEDDEFDDEDFDEFDEDEEDDEDDEV